MTDKALVERRCTCRLCSYDIEFAEHLARIPEAEHQFFTALKERWEGADFDAQFSRTGEEPECRLEAQASLLNMMREALEPLAAAATGLSLGTDWNNGVAAKKHGYRQKLLDALPKAIEALATLKSQVGG
jgi:hypothetical protein